MPDFFHTNDDDLGFTEISARGVRSVIKCKNEDTQEGYAIISGEISEYGSLKLPLWSVLGNDSLRLTTREVLHAVMEANEDKDDEVKKSLAFGIYQSLTSLSKWAAAHEKNFRLTMAYTGWVNVEMSECLDEWVEITGLTP